MVGYDINEKSYDAYEYIKEKYKNENLSLGEIFYYEVLDDLQGKDSILNKEEK
ncbi:hypothetical protein [Staphylococcus phage vB_Sau_P68]|nr:hypothetical protein [Staphylococcus phage vB_Sau_P68]